MLQRFQDRVGTAGLIVAIVALVAAMGGGAYAAKSALSGKQKKEVETIAKKFAGKNGTNGAPGANGATGPAGAPGAKGDKGDPGTPGTNGTNGTNGADGKSVESIVAGPTECSGNGGVILEVEGSAEPHEICNGSPWTVGGTLPKGKTETGTWTVGTENTENFKVLAPVSFAIPLASTAGVTVHFINNGGEEEKNSAPIGPKPTACSGTADSPTASPGTLCVYEKNRSGAFESGNGLTFELALGLSTAGSALNFFSEPKGWAFGSWAVTAPTS